MSIKVWNVITHPCQNFNIRFHISIFTDPVNGFPKTCHDAHTSGGQEGYHTLDPELDDMDPISVFCNMSSSPVTAVLHHNLEEWTYVSGYEGSGSYEGQVRIVSPDWPSYHEICLPQVLTNWLNYFYTCVLLTTDFAALWHMNFICHCINVISNLLTSYRFKFRLNRCSRVENGGIVVFFGACCWSCCAQDGRCNCD